MKMTFGAADVVTGIDPARVYTVTEAPEWLADSDNIVYPIPGFRYWGTVEGGNTKRREFALTERVAFHDPGCPTLTYALLSDGKVASVRWEPTVHTGALMARVIIIIGTWRPAPGVEVRPTGGDNPFHWVRSLEARLDMEG